MLNGSEVTIRVIPMGVSGIDPATNRSWGSYEKAIEALERSRTIVATCPPIKLECPRAKPKRKGGTKPGPRPMPWAEETPPPRGSRHDSDSPGGSFRHNHGQYVEAM